MLCRHNMYVQDFGRVRDPDEIARRELVWEKMCTTLEQKTGHEVGAIAADDFRRLLAEEITPDTFTIRGSHPPTPKQRRAATRQTPSSTSVSDNRINKEHSTMATGLTVVK
jgi:hypothetical protein